MTSPTPLADSKLSEQFAGGIKRLVGEVQREIKDLSADLSYRNNMIAAETERTILELGKEQKAAINEALDEFTNYLSKMARREKYMQKCYSQHQKDVSNIRNSAKIQTDSCITFGVKKVEEIPQYTLQHKEEISDSINKIDNVIEECSQTCENSGQLATCVGVRTTEIQREVLGILRNATDALYLASRQGALIVDETKNCLNKVAADIKNQIEDVSIIIEKCIASARSDKI